MKVLAVAPFLSFSILPVVFSAEYLVGVGKDETTGKKGLGFDPSVIHPAAGDTIVWEFRSGQHSVVQSTFENPCTGNGGINSGVQTVSDSIGVDASGLPTVKIIVNDTQPIWFFDEAGGLCSKGAVLAVNPSDTQTAAAFKENAAKAPAAAPSTASTPAVSETGTSAESAPGPTQSSNSANKYSSWIDRYWGLGLGFVSFFGSEALRYAI